MPWLLVAVFESEVIHSDPSLRYRPVENIISRDSVSPQSNSKISIKNASKTDNVSYQLSWARRRLVDIASRPRGSIKNNKPNSLLSLKEQIILESTEGEFMKVTIGRFGALVISRHWAAQLFRGSTPFLLSTVKLLFIAMSWCLLNSSIADYVHAQSHSKNNKSSQLIIKFKDDVSDPSNADFVKALSRDAKYLLVYIRPMSGGAHVFRVVDFIDDSQLSEVIQRLLKRSDVTYAEQDRTMQHQDRFDK
jgi:hypothetical protein